MPVEKVPVVDFSAYSLNIEREEVDVQAYQALAVDLHRAFSTIGFVYLQNHGIPGEQVDEIMKLANDFFTQPLEVKHRYKRGQGLKNHGWVRTEREKLADFRPADLKECYDVNPLQAELWPDEEVPMFRPAVTNMYKSCRKLGARLLELMAISLNLKDPQYFTKCHNPNRPTYTQLRCLYYPPLADDAAEVKPNQIRCSEHTDYGSLTLLFQDDAGGLEVWNREGNFVPAPTIPGSIIVNLGDLMQRWTADHLVSTLHRVLMPEASNSRHLARQSIACFIHPDEDMVVECVDGSNKYPPILASDYLLKRFEETFTS